MSDGDGQRRRIKIAATGHDEDGPYVDVRGFYAASFAVTECVRLRIGDVIELEPRASFTWTLNGDKRPETHDMSEGVA